LPDYASPSRYTRAHRLLRIRSKHRDCTAWRRRRLVHNGAANYHSLCSRSEHYLSCTAIGYGSTNAADPTSYASLAILADAVHLFRRQHAGQHRFLRCGGHRQSKRERAKRSGRRREHASGLHEFLGFGYSHEQGSMACGVSADTAQDWVSAVSRPLRAALATPRDLCQPVKSCDCYRHPDYLCRKRRRCQSQRSKKPRSASLRPFAGHPGDTLKLAPFNKC